MTDTATVRLYDLGQVVTSFEIPAGIMHTRPLLRWRNTIYRYQRDAFDRSVHYMAVPDPLNVDEIATEL